MCSWEDVKPSTLRSWCFIHVSTSSEMTQMDPNGVLVVPLFFIDFHWLGSRKIEDHWRSASRDEGSKASPRGHGHDISPRQCGSGRQTLELTGHLDTIDTDNRHRQSTPTIDTDNRHHTAPGRKSAKTHSLSGAFATFNFGITKWKLIFQ